MKDTFGLPALTAELTTDEGRRQFPYTDTKGYLSIAIGRNLTGRGLSADEIDYLFGNDVALCCDVMDREIAWWRTLPPPQQRVMINLCFMGWGTLSQFTHFLAAMERQDWPAAAGELVNSLWYRQVAERGPRVVGRLLSVT
jgi:GH24 family phage-related lysozyme (muramidase)